MTLGNRRQTESQGVGEKRGRNKVVTGGPRVVAQYDISQPGLWSPLEPTAKLYPAKLHVTSGVPSHLYSFRSRK